MKLVKSQGQDALGLWCQVTVYAEPLTVYDGCSHLQNMFFRTVRMLESGMKPV